MFGANKVSPFLLAGNAADYAYDWGLGVWDSLSTTRQPKFVIGHVDDPEWPNVVADIKAERESQTELGVSERDQLDIYHLNCNDASQAATLLAAGYTPEALIAQGFDDMMLEWLVAFAEHPSDYRRAFKTYVEPRPVIRTTRWAEGGDASAGYHSSTSGQEIDDENNGLASTSARDLDIPDNSRVDENMRRRLLIAAAKSDDAFYSDEKDSTITMTPMFGKGDDDLPH